MRAAILLFLSLILLFSGSNCRKANHYPAFSLCGLWVGAANGSAVCEFVYIDIPKNSKGGKYSGRTNAMGCDKSWTGTVHVTNSHLYVGYVRFKFIDKPKLVDGDSLYYWANVPGKGKISAVMTLENSFLHGNVTYFFQRVKEY